MKFIFIQNIIMDTTPYKTQMDKALHYLENEFMSLQLGRASTWLVENITVHASYGDMKVPQIAHVTILDPQTLKQNTCIDWRKEKRNKQKSKKYVRRDQSKNQDSETGCYESYQKIIGKQRNLRKWKQS